MRLLLIASSGGHIFEMFCLREFWKDKDRTWVSFPTADAKYLLQEEKEVHWAAYPTVRSVPNLLRNLVLAQRLLRQCARHDPHHRRRRGRPVPLAGLAPRHSHRLSSSPSRESPTSRLTARLVKPFATKMLVQWPELEERYPGVEHHGRIV